MDESNLALDALEFIRQLAPLLLILGGISFADLTINFFINLVKKTKGKVTFK